jgi:hypothetical protein
MEFLDGRDLCSILDDEAPLTSARAVDILSQVLSALVVAHEMAKYATSALRSAECHSPLPALPASVPPATTLSPTPAPTSSGTGGAG